MNLVTPTGALRARWAVLMVLVTSIAMVAAGYAYTRHVQSQIECLTDYAAENQQRSQILTRIAAEDRQQAIAAEQSITRLITDAIAAQGDRGAGQAAADRYLKTSEQIARKRAELERQRAANPFPETPERTCT